MLSSKKDYMFAGFWIFGVGLGIKYKINYGVFYYQSDDSAFNGILEISLFIKIGLGILII